MLGRYGLNKYFLESKTEVLHQDVDLKGFPRRLLRKSLDNLPSLVMVHVKNSTLEPDGSRRDYLLPVHPELRPIFEPVPRGPGGFGEPQAMTCRNAVASTFGLTGDKYSPEMET